MSYYFLAQIRIKDEKEYQKYIAGAGEIFKRNKGRYLAVENDPRIIEGRWDYTRTVLIEFDNEADFETWYGSSEYQKILKHRLQAADCDTVLIKGLKRR